MKPGIHPEYATATVRCACGNSWQTRSTVGELHLDICSACHPFFTGEQKIVDTAGQVERFMRRLEKAQVQPRKKREERRRKRLERRALLVEEAGEEASAVEASGSDEG